MEESTVWRGMGITTGDSVHPNWQHLRNGRVVVGAYTFASVLDE